MSEEKEMSGWEKKKEKEEMDDEWRVRYRMLFVAALLQIASGEEGKRDCCGPFLIDLTSLHNPESRIHNPD